MPTQYDLFQTCPPIKSKESEWGTFKDSLRAPVHSWFTYPAGFSYKAVEHSLKESNLKIGQSTVYDPFMGSGTTNVVAKSLGYNSIGVEAHPFVCAIAKTKMNWQLHFKDVNNALESIRKEISAIKQPSNFKQSLNEEFPELILKCFVPETLFELFLIRNALTTSGFSKNIEKFLRTALICVLRDVSVAATGWPYIAPKKIKITSASKQGWETYRRRVFKMFGDLQEIKRKAYNGKTDHKLLCGDSRDTTPKIHDETIEHIFTSPPYLNNFDYADRTRLEMYFMGDAKNWNDISEKVRTKLITSATTQISRSDSKYQFLDEFKRECGEIYNFLNDAVNKLSSVRITKGGKKSYDLLTIGYFNDLFQVLRDNFRVLRKGFKAIYILGDSAPYGVHIPTDEIIGEIGKAVGFKKFDIKILRERGGKWAKNPQRHSVKLRESIVVLSK